MLVTLKTAILAALLCLSGVTSAPAPLPSPEPRPIPTPASASIASDDMKHHVKLEFRRYKDDDCHKLKHRTHTIHSGKCETFHHSFSAFAYEPGPFYGVRAPWYGDFGDCVLRMYEDKHCQGKPVLVLHDALRQDHLQHCATLHNGGPFLEAKSLRLTCYKDGEQVDEVYMGGS